MISPRYRAAVLDGMTIVLDLRDDSYQAVSQDDGVKDRLIEVARSLGTDPAAVRLADPHAIPTARRDFDPRDDARPRVHDWLTLALFAPVALWRLRFGRPSSWIPNAGTRMFPALSATVTAANRFQRMRPFIPGLSRCLPHALLLQAFLRAGGHDAMLVIGVRLFPFEAHSWVQAGDIVLTGDFEQTAAYSPIAAG